MNAAGEREVKTVLKCKLVSSGTNFAVCVLQVASATRWGLLRPGTKDCHPTGQEEDQLAG